MPDALSGHVPYAAAMSDRRHAPGLTTVVCVGDAAMAADAEPVAADARSIAVLAVVRERLDGYGGRDARSVADGVCAEFDTPRQAVAFALGVRRALAAGLPRARIGVSTGEAAVAATFAAAIARRAIAGEILVSDVDRQLVGEAAVGFVDRGRCRLPGSTDQWRLWAVDDGGRGPVPPATIGRVAELDLIDDLLAATINDAGTSMLFEGEAGIGKTHVLGEARARAVRAGIRVIATEADELIRRPGAVPHALVQAIQAIHDGGSAAARLHQLFGAVHEPALGADDLSYAIVDAGVELLETIIEIEPVLLVVEDLHWADDLSLALLSALVRRTGTLRLSVVGSMRPTPRPAALDRLVEAVRAGGGRHVRLEALDEVDVLAMASSLTGAAPSQALRRRLDATGGNPLYVTELIRSLDDEQLLRIEAGVADVIGGGEAPAGLHETIVRRLSWLAADTQALLRLASLLGTTFGLGDLAHVTGRSVIDVAAGLREASLAGLIVGEADRLAFRHDLVRQAVYGHMLVGERRELHRAAGQALARGGAPVLQVAQQFARGAAVGDVEAIEWLERAATETLAVSPAGAVELMEQALALAGEHWQGRAALQSRLVEPLAWCGRFDDAQAMGLAALAASPPADVEFAALRGLSAIHGNRGNTAAAIEMLDRAASASGAPADEAVRLRCVAAQLGALTGSTTSAAARRIAAATLTDGLDRRDALTQCLAHQVLGVVATIDGHGATAVDHLRASVRLFGSAAVVGASYLIPDTFLAIGMLELDAVDDAIAAANEARRRAERRGTRAVLPMAHMALAGARFYAGLWDDAIAEVETGFAVSEDTGNMNFVLFCDAMLATIAIRRGDLPTAQNHLAAGAARLAGGVALFGADWLFGAQAELLRAGGDPDSALAVAELTWQQTEPIRYFYGHRQRAITLVRLAIDAGRADLAETVTEAMEIGARNTPAASATATAVLCRAMVGRDPERALEAMGWYRKTSLRPALAICCEETAALLGAAGRRDEAVALLREAAAILTEIDAAGEIARINMRLRGLGARRLREREQRPAFGWDSLTPMERDVGLLVSSGLTNPEIGARLAISRRTVETHLSHAFRKLGLASRTQLAAAIARRRADDPARAASPG